MNPEEIIVTEESIFDHGYDKEVFQDNWEHERKKTRNAIFIIGGIFLVGDLISLSSAKLLNSSTIIYALFVPVIYVGLGFLAKSKPMLSILIAAAIFVCITALTFLSVGATSLIAGLLIKAVIVYLFISGIRHAKDAEEARKKLSLFR